MASLPLYAQNEIYNLEPGEVNWKKGDTVQILPTFPYWNKEIMKDAEFVMQIIILSLTELKGV